MCECIEGTVGETIDITFTFTDKKKQPLDLSIYGNEDFTGVELQVLFGNTEEALIECTPFGPDNNMVIQSFTLGEVPGRRIMKFKLTKPNGEFRYYEACHYLVN